MRMAARNTRMPGRMGIREGFQRARFIARVSCVEGNHLIIRSIGMRSGIWMPDNRIWIYESGKKHRECIWRFLRFFLNAPVADTTIYRTVDGKIYMTMVQSFQLVKRSERTHDQDPVRLPRQHLPFAHLIRWHRGFETRSNQFTTIFTTFEE